MIFDARYAVYNDGYSYILGAKHPEALGKRIFEIWPEVESTVGEMLKAVLSEGRVWELTNIPLVLERPLPGINSPSSLSLFFFPCLSSPLPLPLSPPSPSPLLFTLPLLLPGSLSSLRLPLRNISFACYSVVAIDETYFTATYSPVCSTTDDTPLAAWCVTHDTTSNVIGERRLETLRALADCSSSLSDRFDKF